MEWMMLHAWLKQRRCKCRAAGYMKSTLYNWFQPGGSNLVTQLCSCYKNNYLQEPSYLLFSNSVDSKWQQRRDIKLYFHATVFIGPHMASYLLYALSFLALSKALSMVFSFSPLHLGQYHLPLGLWWRPTQEKWNHSMGHSSLSQPIISP